MNQKIEHALALLTDCDRVVDSVGNFFKFQLLGNADTLESRMGGGDPNTRDVETLIKHPFRRQVGRLRGLKRLYDEAHKELLQGLEEFRIQHAHNVTCGLSTVKTEPTNSSQ